MDAEIEPSAVVGGRRTVVGDDRGVVGAILLFPVFATCALLLVQGVLWQQDRTVARTAVDRASAAIALYDASSGSVRDDVVRRMRTAGLRDVSVSIDRGATRTTVTATARSHGLLPFTSTTVSVRSVTPTDRFVAP